VPWSETFGANASFTWGNQLINYLGPDKLVDTAGSVGSAIGAALGGNDLFLRIAGATVVSTMSEDLAKTLLTNAGYAVNIGATNNLSGLLNDSLGKALQEFGVDFSNSQGFNELGGEIESGISGVLMSELAGALHLQGFEAGLFTSFGTTITTTLVDNSIKFLGSIASGESLEASSKLLYANFDPSKLVLNMGNMVGGYLGSYLGSQLVKPENDAGAIGGSIGSSIGSAIATLVLSSIPVIGPFIGAFLGEIVGTLVGDMFEGPRKAMAVASAYNYGVGVSQVWDKNGGSPKLVYDLAKGVSEQVNTLAVDASSLIQFVAGGGGVTFYQRGNVVTAYEPDFTQLAFEANSPSEGLQHVIDLSAFDVLKYAKFVSADPVMLATLGSALSRENSTLSVVADLTIGKDYETYLDNSDLIDTMIEANPDSSFAMGWELTLLKAQELGLTKVTTAPGWTATLFLNSEAIFDATGNLVEGLVFNPDGTQSVSTTFTIATDDTTVTIDTNNAVSGAGQDYMISDSGNRDVVTAG
jgi:hypothetical protein